MSADASVRSISGGGSTRRQRLGLLAGLVLLGLWALWWAKTLDRGEFVHRDWVWFDAIPGHIAIDFEGGALRPVRTWLSGTNPYTTRERDFIYPPAVLPTFAWTAALEYPTAKRIWIFALIGIALLAGWRCAESRRRLGLTAIPITLVWAAILFSTPVMYAFERGNIDLSVVLLLLVALRMMRGGSWVGDAAAGALLAYAAALKIYPGLLVVGLVALRRWRVLAGFVLAGAAVGAAYLPVLQAWRENMEGCLIYARSELPSERLWPHNIHSLTNSWRVLWSKSSPDLLARVPGFLVSAVVLGLPLLWVSTQFARCPRRDRLAYPFLLWLLATATFVPEHSIDYNLFYLPLAALALWDRRDPPIVHLLMGWLILWWQPFRLPMDGRLLFLFKLAGLLATGVILRNRIREQSRVGSIPESHLSPASRPARGTALHGSHGP